MSYLFFAFILETQTRRSLLKALAIVCPGLVRLELHCWGGGGGLFGLLFSFLFFFFKDKPGKNTQRREEEVNSGAAASLLLSASVVGDGRESEEEGLVGEIPMAAVKSVLDVCSPPEKKPKCVSEEEEKIKAPADARDFQSAVSVQPRRHRSYVDYSLHSTALLWTHLRMAADSVQ